MENIIVSVADKKLRTLKNGATFERDFLTKTVIEAAAFLGHTADTFDVNRAVAALEERFAISVGAASVLSNPDANHVDWYRGDRKVTRRFFERYADQLQDLDWAQAAIDGIDDATDRIMEQMEDPLRAGPWDTRGLVVGHVQSGKTANYAGLMAKAADAGYRLIIVLAGMHNALRQQTQKRIDRDFLGYDTRPDAGRARIGVGKINPSLAADHITTQAANGDFRKAAADNMGVGVQQRPVLLVIKKNASILKNLNNWIKDVVAERGDAATTPLLVIDDEADQASVDTGVQDQRADEEFDPDYDPKKINGEIRKLLNAFPRSAYVAYTATPFANILIHDERQAEHFGADLFPRDFIVNLQAPSNYVGPASLFGINAEDPGDAQAPLPLCRDVDQVAEAWLSPDHKKDATPRYKGEAVIPPSLEDAVIQFVIACAVRRVRGHDNAHNSMLVHVSRFKDVHQKVHKQVDIWLADMKRQLRFRTGADALLKRMQKLWHEDFTPTSDAMAASAHGSGISSHPWDAVESELFNAVDRIRVQVVNSDLKEPIDYDGHPDGLSVIAVGGDKLSRGLTLEGLSVSYFLRASKMYDSLMQMGRWFGYRPGYLDLCRLHMPVDLQAWFRHVATASEELRDRLDRMARLGARPKDYGLRVKSHEVLLVTARNKMRYATEHQVSFAGDGKIQTVFHNDDVINNANAAAVAAFLQSLGPMPADGFEVERTANQSSGRKWSGVSGTAIAGLLRSLRFPNGTYDPDQLCNYIGKQQAVGELIDWTVVIPAGRGQAVPFAGAIIRTVERTEDSGKGKPGEHSFGTILSPLDEALDLNEGEFAHALQLTNAARATKGKAITDRPSGPDIRIARGSRPQRGLLLIYPIDPAAVSTSLQVPLFGIVVSFPETQNAEAAWYRYNSVERRQEGA